MAEDSQLSALVTERRLDATLFAPHVTRCFLDDVPLAVASADGLGVRTLGEDPAYVLYTSGSTGKPKGVVVPQRAVVNFLASMAEAPGFSHQDRLLAVTTLSFDISVLELLLPLSVGGTVVLATSSDSSDGGALRRLLHDKHVSVLQATPATWRLLLAAGEDFYPGFKALCGGEPLPKSLADELIGLGVELWNMYGPTETTVWSTCQRIASGTGRISIGRPIANTQVHILDDQQRIVPVGVTGELCIAGDGVTLGYLRRPELTAERFVTNPYGAGRLYRTGDLARYLPDGTLECLGRNDSQVKLRGYRIELGEIESVLSQLLAVQQAVVMVREDRPGDQRLVAYLVPTTEMPPLENLRNELRRALPEYMVPGQFVELASIPLTPNGKIDRKRLPAPVAPSAGAEAATAETQSERLLQRIWQRALGVSQISATDDFFQLGGHSLLAAQLVAQISRETGIQLPMRRVFEAPTLRGLAKVLDDERRSDDTPSSGIARRQEQSVSPLSSMQQRLWFIEEMNPGTSLYNLPSSFRLSGALNRDALQRALNTIAERHTALRTTFQIRNGEIVQALSGKLTFDLTPIDLRQIPREERELKLRSLLSQAAAEPFNLRTGPLARAALFLLAEDESVLFFMPHHAVWDGWSFDVFLDELDQLYAAYCRGEPSPLTDLPVTYGDFAAWQQSFLGSPENARQTRFWLDQLSGELPVLELPTDAPRPSRMSFAGATEPFELDAALLQELSQLAVANGATLYMMLLAAFYAQLFRLTGQDELIVGTPVRGRNRPELEGLLGFFVNTLALRRRVDGHESFVSLLARVREACVQAFGHQEMPFELLMQKLPIARDLSRTPVYSAFFTFQDVRNRKSSIGDLSFDQLHVHAPVSPTDVSLWVKQLDSKLVGGLDYATDIIQRDSAARWVAAFQRLLTEIVLDPKRSVFELVAVPPAERLALEAISNTSCDYPRAAYLHQLIEAQVDRTPHAVAAVCGAARVTYAELDERANRLARALRQRGAQPGSRVGICLERSLDLLVAALAVQKSGAAYVPLDPNFPAERLQFMANDANVSVMLVHERTRAGAPLIEAADVLDLDADRTDIASCDGSRIDGVNEAAESAPLYVIYTSGSSGKPKGVVVPHRAVVNFVTSMAREPGIHSDDRLLAVTTLSFDIAVLELYAPLTVGAQVVIASREMIADGDLLDEAIDEHEITIMQATPSTWRLLLAAGFRGGQNFRVLCGGEAFPRDLAEQLLDVAGEVWNLYGPTETTVWSTCQRLERPLERITIGRPIANTSVHVVDARGQLVPWGSEGELWIGGDGVALGYHARQELTADRFVANPFRPGRVYKTGDLVRLRSNGELEYLRRNDNQVKLRGYRIELGEVEAALGRVPGVRQAVALVREDRTADHRLVAYLTTTGGELSETALRQELRAFLPEYMIPQHIVMLDAFPLTPNGKIDRRALPSPEGAVALPLEGYLPPRTEKEKLVATLWQEVLGVDRVSARDNFFDIGGHSLLCLQMTARLEQRTGTRVNPRVVLRNDLSQIAALLPDASPALPPPAAAAAPSSSSLARRLLGRLTGR
jgi:amino acid adenylation domain-containing protein